MNNRNQPTQARLPVAPAPAATPIHLNVFTVEEYERDGKTQKKVDPHRRRVPAQGRPGLLDRTESISDRWSIGGSATRHDRRSIEISANHSALLGASGPHFLCAQSQPAPNARPHVGTLRRHELHHFRPVDGRLVVLPPDNGGDTRNNKLPAAVINSGPFEAPFF